MTDKAAKPGPDFGKTLEQKIQEVEQYFSEPESKEVLDMFRPKFNEAVEAVMQNGGDFPLIDERHGALLLATLMKMGSGPGKLLDPTLEEGAILVSAGIVRHFAHLRIKQANATKTNA